MDGEVCVTCGDRALPLRVVAPGAEPGLARCADAEGREEEVEVSLLAPVAVGERLLVHAGAAIARVEEEQT
jgi:hydrogenase maturation factor